MKTALLIFLSLAFSGLAATIIPIPYSAEPRATVVSTNDDLILNATNSGTGTWTTKRATVGSVAAAVAPLISSAVSSATTNTWRLDATNAANAIARDAVANQGLVSSSLAGLMTTNLYAAALVNLGVRRQAAPLPPRGVREMAWNEDSAITTAQWLNGNGMAAMGFNLIWIDTGWCSGRDGNGYLIASTNGLPGNRFPNGIPFLVEALKTNNCYLGLYLRGAPYVGYWTWDTGPGTTVQYAYQDGYQLGQWGVRLLKLDSASGFDSGGDMVNRPKTQYALRQLAAGMDDATTKSNLPPIFFHAVCDTGTASILPSYPGLINGLYQSWFGDPTPTSYADLAKILVNRWSIPRWWSQPGTFFDPQGVGSTNSQFYYIGYDTNAFRAGIGSACLMPYPLWINCNVNCKPSTGEMSILTNQNMLSIQGDPAALSGQMLSSNGYNVVLSRKMANNDVVLGLFNLSSNTPASFSVPLSSIPDVPGNQVSIVDVFDGVITGATNTLSVTVNAGGFNLYRLSKHNGPTASYVINGIRIDTDNGAISGIAPFDSDASNYLAAIGYTVGNDATSLAVDSLVKAAKAHNWWTNCDCIFPFIGSNTNQMGRNLKGAIFPAYFASAMSCTSTGITGNGTTFGWVTNMRSFNVFTTNNSHTFAYCGTDPIPTTGLLLMGGYTIDYASSRLGLSPITPTYLRGLFGGSDYLVIGSGTSNIDYRGPMIASKTTSSGYVALRSTITTGTPNFTQIPNGYMGILAASLDSGYPSTTSGYPNFDTALAANLRGMTIGGYISPAAWPTFMADWDAFESALGRKVP